MAKKKRAGATKRGGASRTGASRKKTTRKRAAGASANRVNLKALQRQIEQSVRKLDRISATRGTDVDLVRGQLENMTAAISNLCGRSNPDGCFPTMVFPRAASR